jgi:hypothetical protein
MNATKAIRSTSLRDIIIIAADFQTALIIEVIKISVSLESTAIPSLTRFQ